MRVYYDQAQLTVNGTGLFAENAVLSINNNLNPAYTIGRIGVSNYVPNGAVVTNFTFSYVPELNKEPNFGLLNLVKQVSNDVSWSGATLVIGGVTGYNCYPNSYNIEVDPNNLLRARVSYTTFVPVSGSIQEKTSNTYGDASTVTNGWGTYILTSGQYQQVPFYDFSYGFNARWEPVYVLGRKTPVQVNFINGEESMTFTRDIFQNVTFSGENSTGLFQDFSSANSGVNIYALSIMTGAANPSSLNFSVASGRIVQSNLDLKTDEFITVKTTITKAY